MFCTYLFYNFCTTLHVSNDHFVHHQGFINLLYLQLCTNRADVPNCSGITGGTGFQFFVKVVVVLVQFQVAL